MGSGLSFPRRALKKEQDFKSELFLLEVAFSPFSKHQLVLPGIGDTLGKQRHNLRAFSGESPGILGMIKADFGYSRGQEQLWLFSLASNTAELSVLDAATTTQSSAQSHELTLSTQRG